MNQHPSVRDVFLQHQEQMTVALKCDRTNVPHPGAKGAASELCWIDMLRRHLPCRYSVDSAFVLDHSGSISDQIDVVIYDRQYTPLLRAERGTIYVPAEGVYAVFEVRQELSKRNLDYAGRKAASVRSLKRTSAAINHAGGNFEPKKPHTIIAGLLTLTTAWDPAFGESFVEGLAPLVDGRRLDLGCALRDGAWSVPDGPDARPVVSASDQALIVFFLDLLQQLQQVATVAAIDFDYYRGALSPGP
ncbi:MAG TPA: DUF6602 domain-containing protein [Vicinamibacteria bacterium]|nr:DUF6602 domain-containing protein [Vicinamibacteria bacterium]